MKIELMASMMCADFGNLRGEIRVLEEAGIDSFHIDIMDGRFVENFAMSLNDLSFLSKNANRPIDLHLMIENPLRYMDIFLRKIRPGDTVYIHPESEYHMSNTMNKIIERGMVPGVALNPCTSIENVKECLYLAKKVLVMTVDTGEAGMPYQSFVSDKIKRLIEMKEEYGFKIYLDGACNDTRIIDFSNKGVDGFVLGSSLLFTPEKDYKKTILQLRNGSD